VIENRTGQCASTHDANGWVAHLSCAWRQPHREQDIKDRCKCLMAAYKHPHWCSLWMPCPRAVLARSCGGCYKKRKQLKLWAA